MASGMSTTSPRRSFAMRPLVLLRATIVPSLLRLDPRDMPPLGAAAYCGSPANSSRER